MPPEPLDDGFVGPLLDRSEEAVRQAIGLCRGSMKVFPGLYAIWAEEIRRSTRIRGGKIIGQEWTRSSSFAAYRTLHVCNRDAEREKVLYESVVSLIEREIRNIICGEDEDVSVL